MLPRRQRHFFPGLLQGVDHFVIGGSCRQLGDLKFQENQTERVLQHATVRVLREVLLQIQCLHLRDRLFRVTDRAQNFSRLLGVEFFEVLAPFQIAGPGQGIAAARNHPATDVLAARRQTEFFGGVGAEFQDPVFQALRVNQFARPGDAFNDFKVRIQ